MRSRAGASSLATIALLVLSLAGASCTLPHLENPPWTKKVQGANHVTFFSHDRDLTRGEGTIIDGWLFRPEGEGPFPAIVALHGCGGLYGKEGGLSERHRDWADRLVKQGYVVLFPDSFSVRGFDEVCSVNSKAVRAWYERSRDAYGALEYLQTKSYVIPDRIGLLGWSNGGTTLFSTLSRETRSRPGEVVHDFKVGVAFYPQCRSAVESSAFLPTIAPVHVLVGASDDWTPASDCKALADQSKEGKNPLDLTVYPGAYQDFDSPTMKVHRRENVGTTDSGTAMVGTNPEARADAIEKVTRIFHDALHSSEPAK